MGCNKLNFVVCVGVVVVVVSCCGFVLWFHECCCCCVVVKLRAVRTYCDSGFKLRKASISNCDSIVFL